MFYFHKFNRFILISLALLGLTVSTANAALVTELLNVDIDGSLYDVRFHNAPGDSFYGLWEDGDGDGSFSAVGSLFDSAPTFWGDSAGAAAAAAAIIAALGSADTTSSYGFDTFYVAYGYFGGDRILVQADPEVLPSIDSLISYNFIVPNDFYPFYPYASFTDVSVVPIPAAIWLFGTALIGLVGFGKRRKAA